MGLWQAAAARGLSEEQVRDHVLPLLRKVVAFAKRHELHVLRTAVTHLVAIEGGARASMQLAMQETSAHFSRALHDTLVWRMTRDDAALYNPANPIKVPATLGQEAVRDGVEAARCYAASRYTAAGFHAMRVAERVARNLIPRAGLRTKKFYPLDRCDHHGDREKTAAEEKRRQSTPKGRRRISASKFKWLTDFVATFRSLKNAWRNPIGHYDSCDRHKALELINVARALVREYRT